MKILVENQKLKEELYGHDIVSNIKCNRCGNILPPHRVSEHLDKNHPIHEFTGDENAFLLDDYKNAFKNNNFRNW